MIIWKGRQQPVTKEVTLRVGSSAHRWVLDVGRWYISLQRQFESGGRWEYYNGDHFSIDITRDAYWGGRHVYYDGPNCSFSLGHLCFNWRYWWCKRCVGDDGCSDGT